MMGDMEDEAYARRLCVSPDRQSRELSDGSDPDRVGQRAFSGDGVTGHDSGRPGICGGQASRRPVRLLKQGRLGGCTAGPAGR
jgi:hypothetical protein